MFYQPNACDNYLLQFLLQNVHLYNFGSYLRITQDDLALYEDEYFDSKGNSVFFPSTKPDQSPTYLLIYAICDMDYHQKLLKRYRYKLYNSGLKQRYNSQIDSIMMAPAVPFLFNIRQIDRFHSKIIVVFNY